MMRKIGLDIGDVRIGIAVSDILGCIAGAHETYTRKGLKQDMEYFAGLIKAQQADTVVLGLPINMDGTEGKRVEIVKAFAGELGKYTDAKIVFQDERLSTVSAERMLIEADMRREKRKEVIDKVAATIILQSYLDYKL